jgi:hypothetical protein
MTKQNQAQEVIETHPDGRRAVLATRLKEQQYYEALDPHGLSVGVYDVADEAVSAAHWAWDFLQEEPGLRRLTLMQLILEKLTLQYPLDAADVTLGTKG